MNVVPINHSQSHQGHAFESNPRLPVLEILKAIACFRFILPRQEITICRRAHGESAPMRKA